MRRFVASLAVAGTLGLACVAPMDHIRWHRIHIVAAALPGHASTAVGEPHQRG